MSTAELPLFSATALAVLDRQAYDPQARAYYELMSGGLIWPDEFPHFGTSEWVPLSSIALCRYLIAYRASITLGEERSAFRPVWEQVLLSAPRWPGLREERRGERAKRRLLAAKRLEVPCLEKLEAAIKAADV
jgi:hypothetical protein